MSKFLYTFYAPILIHVNIIIHPPNCWLQELQIWSPCYLTGTGRQVVEGIVSCHNCRVHFCQSGFPVAYSTNYLLVNLQCSHVWNLSLTDGHIRLKRSHQSLSIGSNVQNIYENELPLKRKCCHFDEILITDCTESFHFDNFRCSQWWKFRQNDDISVSVSMIQSYFMLDVIYIRLHVESPQSRWLHIPHFGENLAVAFNVTVFLFVVKVF